VIGFLCSLQQCSRGNKLVRRDGDRLLAASIGTVAL
jgi:hypothetical protein